MSGIQDVEEPPPAVAVPADLADERLIQTQGLSGYLKASVDRIRGGDLGSLPVIVGLIVIVIGFYLANPAFLSSYSVVSMMQFAAPIGVISLGIVIVLLVGEIDLSVGAVSGFAGAILATQLAYHGQSTLVALIAGLAAGAIIGLIYATLYNIVGVPSFVISLGGLLAFQGALLVVLGSNGTVNIDKESGIAQFAREQFVSGVAAYVMVTVIAAIFLGAQLMGRQRRTAAGLSAKPMVLVLTPAILLWVALLIVTWWINQDRGWSSLFLLFAFLVVITDLALRRTTWGRHLFAVGGNEEASRRSGIKVNRIYITVFVLCSTLAALGGLLGAGQNTAVTQSTGTIDTNLNAIASAVIGGTSLFGGRGSAYSAMLGILVLQAIQTGLNVVGVEASVRYIVTGIVLVLAVGIDAVSRRARASSGRG